MSSSKVRPCSVVNRLIWSDMVLTVAYIAAMLSRPVLSSGRVQRPGPPDTFAYVLQLKAASMHAPLLCVDDNV